MHTLRFSYSTLLDNQVLGEIKEHDGCIICRYIRLLYDVSLPAPFWMAGVLLLLVAIGARGLPRGAAGGNEASAAPSTGGGIG